MDAKELKPRELRYGNWVKDKATNTPCQVAGIESNQVRIRRLGSSVSVIRDYDEIEAFELTEEWLVKLGFEKMGNDLMPRSVRYELDWIRIFPSNDYCDFKGFGVLWYKPSPETTAESARVKLKYVHQLQNLYFALTGQELTPNHITGE